jgi:hypothetical protein
MPSIYTTQFLMGLMAIGTVAQESPIKLCNGKSCKYCPSSLTTTGTGYPSCVVYDRDTVLGGKVGDYAPIEGESRMIYYDIAPTGGDCQTIIRSPASTTDENCGAPIYGGKGGVCFPGDTKATFMVQFCCGLGDCTAAGAKRSVGSDMSSAVFRDGDGNVVVPRAVGDHTGDKYDTFLEDHGVNSSSTIQSRSAGVPVYKIGYDAPAVQDAPLQKRKKCNKKGFVQEGARYTKTGKSLRIAVLPARPVLTYDSGSESYQVSGYVCDATSRVTIENSNSVAYTTTFGLAVADPLGIVTASVDFAIEVRASQSYSYNFTPKEGQCGHVSFTPFFTCVGGKITGCEGGDVNGEVCTAKRISENQIDGAYTFVQD